MRNSGFIDFNVLGTTPDDGLPLDPKRCVISGCEKLINCGGHGTLLDLHLLCLATISGEPAPQLDIINTLRQCHSKQISEDTRITSAPR